MTDCADIPFLADGIEARQYDELAVEHAFEAMIDEDVSDGEEYSTRDDWDSDDDSAAATIQHTIACMCVTWSTRAS